MEIKFSYVRARRFIDFHTLIRNSYEKIKKSLAFAGIFLYNELVATNISYTNNTKSSYA